MPYDYDLQDSALFANPYPFYQKLRSRHPVHLDSHLGCWVVTSYADAVAGLANRDLSSERAMQGTVLQEKAWQELSPLFAHISQLMFYSDPPKHTRIRGLINKAFSARMIEKWRATIQTIVDTQLAAVQEQGHLDIIKNIAFPLPAQVIAEMLGIPVHDREQFKRWSDDLVDFLGNPPTLEQCTRLMHSLQAFIEYFREIVAQHRQTPKDDLVDALLSAEEQGSTLTEDELLVNCVGLFAGGHETTMNAIGNGMLALLRHPESLASLRDQPTLIVSAVEELLRYDSPVQFTARIAQETTKVGSKKVYKGQKVMLMLGAANRDPAQFREPDSLDLHRQENRHLAFGHNIHYCIGAALARLEAQIAIATLVQRLPHITLHDTPLEWQENLSFHGVKALHVTF